MASSSTITNEEDEDRMCKVIIKEEVDEKEEEASDNHHHHQQHHHHQKEVSPVSSIGKRGLSCSSSGSSPNSELEETIVKIKPMLSMIKTPGSGHHHRIPFVKQMEQTMNRNYSDFMRSLAAKYNNRNPAGEEQDESFSLNHVNGFIHKSGGAGEALKAATPPLLNSNNHIDIDDRKSDNHSAPPVLLAAAAIEHHHRNTSGQLLRPMVDLSSTQMLLHMMRSACNASTAAAATESSTTNHNKRHVDGLGVDDALDLSVKASKRWRGIVDVGCGSFPVVADPIGLLPRTGGQRVRHNNNNKTSFETSFAATGLSRSSIEATDVAIISKNNKSRVANHRKHHSCVSNCACKRNSVSAVVKWNVDDVCAFVSGVDACAEYVQAFRDQSIDGDALYMLTEDHLTNQIKMKLGHALRFKAALAKLIGACAVCLHCSHCHQQQSNGDALQRQQ